MSNTAPANFCWSAKHSASCCGLGLVGMITISGVGTVAAAAAAADALLAAGLEVAIVAVDA